MHELHPSSRQLEQFCRGSLPRHETSGIVRHLLAGCRRCSAAAAAYWPPPAPEEMQLERGFERALVSLRDHSEALAAERAAAPGLLAELERHPAVRQRVLARNSRRFRTVPLAELVMQRAFVAGYDDPAATLELAELGFDLARALDESSCPAVVAADLRGRALATRGNARRIGGDQTGAARDLERARRELETGTGDPLEEAFVFLRTAYLETDRRQFAAADRRFDAALALFRSVGEHHWVGRTLIDKALARGYAGEPQAAIELIERGLELLDPGRDPRMALAAKHNLALFRCESGDLDRATALIHELLPQYAARRERLSMLRLRWLEGRLAQAQGRLPQAEEAFVEVQEAFADRRMGFDAALAALDLAGVYLEQDRAAELEALGAQLVAVFRTLEVHREALVALTLFRRAVELRQVTRRWIRELAAYLEQARRKPGLRFEPPAGPPLT